MRLVLAVLALVLAEASFRALLWVRGDAYGSDDARRALERMRSEMWDSVPTGGDGGEASPERPNRFQHPYLGWETLRGLARIEGQARKRGAENSYEIWVVGGSVAAGFGEKDREGAPTLIAELQADPRFQDRPIRVISHGRGAFKQPQQINLVTFLLAILPAPDAVINLDGFNEVAIGNQNAVAGVHPAYPSMPQWLELARTDSSNATLLGLALEIQRQKEHGDRLMSRTLGWGLHRSAISGWLAVRRMGSVRAAWGQAQAEYAEALGNARTDHLKGPSYPDGEEAIYRAVRVWTESSRSLHAICAARGIHYLHVLQPTLHDRGSKPLTEEEIGTGAAADTWIEGVRVGYPLLRAAGERLKTQGVAFHDTSQVFAETPETLYFDACHFVPRGNAILARAVARAFLESLPD